MTNKQYLQQAFRLNDIINADIKELNQLRLLSRNVSSTNTSGTPKGTSKGDAPFVNVIEKIADLEQVINDEIDRLVDLKKEIRMVINQVEDNSQRLCLMLRYMNFEKWDVIAAQLNTSVKQAFRIHKDALRNVKIPDRSNS